MLKARNSDREIELRKYRDILETVGSGIKIFAIWTILKMLSLFIINIKEANAFILSTEAEAMSPQEQKIFLAVTYALLALTAITVTPAQIYVGNTAISVGRGTNKKDKKLYIVFAVIMLINCIFTIITFIFNAVKMNVNDPGVMGQFRTSIIVEITYLVMLVELLTSSHKIRKLTEGRHFKR